MHLLFLLRNSLLFSLLILLPIITTAQSSISLEGGAVVSSLYSTQPEFKPTGFEDIDNFKPAIGFRAGVALEHAFEGAFALKTGAAYTLKGAHVFKDFRHSLGYICFPVLAIWSPVKTLKVGLGLEFSALLTNNAPLPPTNSVALGVRSELAWQINPKFRLILHGTADFTNSERIQYTDDQGYPVATNHYKHITGGVSLAYVLHTFGE